MTDFFESLPKQPLYFQDCKERNYHLEVPHNLSTDDQINWKKCQTFVILPCGKKLVYYTMNSVSKKGAYKA